jgi:hypothetical protein
MMSSSSSSSAGIYVFSAYLISLLALPSYMISSLKLNSAYDIYSTIFEIQYSVIDVSYHQKVLTHAKMQTKCVMSMKIATQEPRK